MAMQSDRKRYTLTYRHDVFEGSPNEAGRWQGERMSDDHWRGSFSGKPPFLKFYTRQEAEKALRLADDHCPGIADEIQGASETSRVPIEKMTFLGGCVEVTGTRYPTLYSVDEPPKVPDTAGGCSHFYLPRRLAPQRHLRTVSYTHLTLPTN